MRWVFYHPSFWSFFCLDSSWSLIGYRSMTLFGQACCATASFNGLFRPHCVYRCFAFQTNPSSAYDCSSCFSFTVLQLACDLSDLLRESICNGSTCTFSCGFKSLSDFCKFKKLSCLPVDAWQLLSVHGCMSNVKLWRWNLWSSMCVGFASFIFLKVCSGSCLLILWSL